MEGREEEFKLTSVNLTQEQHEFLAKLSKCCRYSGGCSLSKVSIIRCLLRVLNELKIDYNSIKSEEELKERILEAFQRGKNFL